LLRTHFACAAATIIGTIKLTIPRAALLAKVEKELKGIDIDNSPYHMNIFDILVTEEHSNFLVDFDKIFCSQSHTESNFINSWSNARGIDNAAQNLVNGPGKSSGCAYYNKILAEGESNIRRHDSQAADPLYIAPSYKNGAEHARWINRNWDDIEATLKKCTNGNAYEIRLPEKERAQEFEFLGERRAQMFLSSVRQMC
jgi:hypothetical protein